VGTGKSVSGSPFGNFYHTESAAAKLGEFWVIAQAWDINAIVQRSLEYIGAFRSYNWFIIDNKMDRLHLIAIKLHFS
jgi:hypothetical protein